MSSHVTNETEPHLGKRKKQFLGFGLCSWSLVLLCWAMVYLPNLGLDEINRNEARRVLPAIGMLHTGNWAVPYLAGRPYYSKPPLQMWLLAGVYKSIGSHSEFMSRLPNALLVLAAGAALLLWPSSLLNRRQRLWAALLFVLTAGVVDEGRSANIDGTYTCVSVMALATWLQAWGKSDYSWRMWLLPGALLGVGLLLKGPLILLFFYVPVLALLWSESRTRQALTWGHLAGFLVMLLIFCAWWFWANAAAPPASKQAPAMTSTWYVEIAHRFNFGELSFRKWASRVCGAVGTLLPAGLPLLLWALVRNDRRLTEKQQRFVKFALIAVGILFVLVNAMPVTKPRYSLPQVAILAPLGGLILGLLPRLIPFPKVIRRFLFSVYVCAVVLVGTFLLVQVFGLLPRILAIAPPSLHEKISGQLSSFWLLSSFLLLTVVGLTLFIDRRRQVKYLLPTLQYVFLLIAIGFASFFICMQPLSLTDDAFSSATVVNENVPDGKMIYGINYVGREPFVFYLKGQHRFVPTLEDLTCPVEYIIVETGTDREVHQYSQEWSLSIASSIPFHYEKHKYLLIHLEKNHAQVNCAN